MSKLNGDKARHNRQQYRKALLRQRNRKLRARLALTQTIPQDKTGKV
jgi:hypothetical protein